MFIRKATTFFLLAIALLFPATAVEGGQTPVTSSQNAVYAEALDSLTMQFIGFPDPQRKNLLADSVRSRVVINDGNFLRWITFAQSLEKQAETDDEKAGREQWVILIIGLLVLLLGVVRVSFPNEVLSIIQAFYNDRVLLQINKEDTLYSSWPFVFLYVLFGFAVGLFIHVCNQYYVPGGMRGGIDSFFGISVFVMLLFILKIIATRLLGIIFEVQRIVREYISILYLSYFNAALVFLPTVLALSLVPQNQMVWIVPASLLLVTGMFIFRFLKTATSLFANYRFSKFYLFMYLCCLEIAPVLILVKVLGN